MSENQEQKSESRNSLGLRIQKSHRGRGLQVERGPATFGTDTGAESIASTMCKSYECYNLIGQKKPEQPVISTMEA